MVSVAEKAHKMCQVRTGKANVSEPLLKRRKRSGVIRTGVQSLPRDEPGGCLLIGQVVSGMEVARAWFGLWCGTWEPVVPRLSVASGAVVACGRWWKGELQAADPRGVAY